MGRHVFGVKRENMFGNIIRQYLGPIERKPIENPMDEKKPIQWKLRGILIIK